MKKCPYCGKEYPDDVERCLIDDEILLGGEPPNSTVEADSTPIHPPVSFLTTIYKERQLQIFEVVLVCLIAFGTAILSSTHLFFGERSSDASSASSSFTVYSWIYSCLRELSALGLVWYLLQRSGKTFADLGLIWQAKDIGRSIILYAGGELAFYVVYGAIYYSGLTESSYHATFVHVGQILFGSGISYATLLFQFLNPFFEELIVRAYLMTMVKQLTGSMTKAIIISTVLQTSYHFYQGAPAALAHGATFLIFSIYYAKTNRIAPIVLAHLYSDVGATLWYFLRQ